MDPWSEMDEGREVAALEFLLWPITPSIAVAGEVFFGPGIYGAICSGSGWTFAKSAPEAPNASCCGPRRWVAEGVRGGVVADDGRGEGLGEEPPDLVATLEVW